jgi:hypothetical protein
LKRAATIAKRAPAGAAKLPSKRGVSSLIGSSLPRSRFVVGGGRLPGRPHRNLLDHLELVALDRRDPSPISRNTASASSRGVISPR